MRAEQEESVETAFVDALRAARTAGYVLLDPFDRVLRRFTGREGLPPLSLRRHAGPVRAFSTSTEDLVRLLSKKDLLKEGMTVLDLGCGPGAVPLKLLEEGLAVKSYVGIDVHERSIAWCRRRFAGNPAFRFEVAEVRSPYGRGRTGDAADYRFPVGDGSVDLALAKSLFTHLLPETARRYLSEMRRCLSGTGRGLLTAFVFDGRPGSGPPAFPYHGADPKVRWRRRAHPHAAVAYERSLFEKMLENAGLEISEMLPGFWPGTSAAIRGQDTYIVRLRDSR